MSKYAKEFHILSSGDSHPQYCEAATVIAEAIVSMKKLASVHRDVEGVYQWVVNGDFTGEENIADMVAELNDLV